VKRGQRLPSDQAEIAFDDIFVEQLEGLPAADQVDVLAAIVALCMNPAGKHPLSGPLAGWNTLDVSQGQQRVICRASTRHGVGLVEVLCLGVRRNNEIYDVAMALVASGRLTDDEITQIWEALAVLDVTLSAVGLDGWDFRPTPAPEGMQRAAVAAGLLTQAVAELLSADEITAAMTGGWSADGADPAQALVAALHRLQGSISPDIAARIVAQRRDDRCGVVLPRAAARCIRRRGHPGPHRTR
jgi:hypothetical protein